VVAICEPAARSVISRVVSEAVRAANLFGLTPERASEYGDGILATLPPAFDTMRLPDGPERDAGIEALATSVRAVSESNHVPRLVERGLTAIAVRIAREVVRRGAADKGFTADELEDEFADFAAELEARLNAT
jgi:hypothetical protein